jgi:hypothetical protein
VVGRSADGSYGPMPVAPRRSTDPGSSSHLQPQDPHIACTSTPLRAAPALRRARCAMSATAKVEASCVCAWRGATVLPICNLSKDRFDCESCACCRSCVSCKGSLAAKGPTEPTETTPGTRRHRATVGRGGRPSGALPSSGSRAPELRHAGCSAVAVPQARCGPGSG